MSASILCSLLLASIASAQQSEGEFKLTTDADLVLLSVGVKDSGGHYVSDLTRKNFQVFDQSKLQVISQFAREDAPVTVGLVIDQSGSMRPKRVDVINGAMTFIGASNPRDEVFVIHFNDRVRAGLPENVPFSDDPKLLRASLFNGNAEGKTALYDAVVSALGHLKVGTHDKKSLILVSDGGDNASEYRLNDVIEAVRESQATIYTIGVFDEDDPDRNPSLLRRLAAVSGGEAYFPKELSELNTICRQIATDIRNRYTIGYVPDTQGRSGVRTIRVAANYPGEKHLIVHARTSYRLPDHNGAEKETAKRK